MTNRSAKGGARSSLHYRGEGDLIHPPHQGVCGRHGMEDQCVTLGDLGGSAGGAAATDPISGSFRANRAEVILIESVSDSVGVSVVATLGSLPPVARSSAAAAVWGPSATER